MVGGQWQFGELFDPGFAAIDTLSLTPGAVAPLGTIAVQFLTAPPHAIPLSAEDFVLTPGTYDVRACYFPPDSVSASGGFVPQCGNTVSLTLTP